MLIVLLIFRNSSSKVNPIWFSFLRSLMFWFSSNLLIPHTNYVYILKTRLVRVGTIVSFKRFPSLSNLQCKYYYRFYRQFVCKLKEILFLVVCLLKRLWWRGLVAWMIFQVGIETSHDLKPRHFLCLPTEQESAK